MAMERSPSGLPSDCKMLEELSYATGIQWRIRPPPLRGSTPALGGGPGALPQKNLKFKVAKALEN